MAVKMMTKAESLSCVDKAEVHAAALFEASKAGREPRWSDDVEETSSLFGWGLGFRAKGVSRVWIQTRV